MYHFLIIQTAFIGDVVLATAVAEKLHRFYPDAKIDFLLRKGNETLLKNHPFIQKVIVWDKSNNKWANLAKIAWQVRKNNYSHVINLHRFASSGLISWLSGAKVRVGFDKNPLSVFYTRKFPHEISAPYSRQPVHEVARNQTLIASLTEEKADYPKLYPSAEDIQAIRQWQQQAYICIAPSSVWFTKQFPVEKWIELINALPHNFRIYLLGGKNDSAIANEILKDATHPNLKSLCGALSFLQSAALMQGAKMNYVNDSGPLHFASAMNAPVTAVFCSTVPAFGFGPLRENGRVVEIEEQLYCRPCGLHGFKACPEKHFRCARDIKKEQLLWWISK